MNLQKMMNLAKQQHLANENEKWMGTLRMLILTTIINDKINQDAMDKTLQISVQKEG